MLFGSEFYAKLEKMPAWRHSLFSLVLATRQYPNFVLWAEINQNPQAAATYLNALRLGWQFHADRFNHIDLMQVYEQVEPFLPLDLEDYSEGDSFAYDCGVLIDAALEGIPLNAKYGRDASTASMASVIRLCELKHPEQAQDEESLLELDEINHELEYQVDLLLKVLEPRSLENIRELFAMALQDHVSNIGLENTLSATDFSELFDPRLDQQASEVAQAAQAHAEAEAAAEAEAEAQAKARAKAQRAAARAARMAANAANTEDSPATAYASGETASIDPYESSPRGKEHHGKASDKHHHGDKGDKGNKHDHHHKGEKHGHDHDHDHGHGNSHEHEHKKHDHKDNKGHHKH